MKRTRELSAYREAALAVVSMRLELDFKRVTIAPDGDGHVGVLYNKPHRWIAARVHDPYFYDAFEMINQDNPAAWNYIQCRLVALYASERAECRFLGQRPRIGGLRKTERSAAYDCLRHSVCPPQFESYCWAISRFWVRYSLWPHIREVAAALLLKKKLSYREVEVLFNNTSERLTARRPARR